MNWLAIICAAAAYWIIGAIWYMALFGKIWAAGIQQHGVKLEPSGMPAKMIGNFICNHFRRHSAGFKLHSMLLDARRPNFSEQSHVPDGANDPVSRRCTNYC